MNTLTEPLTERERTVLEMLAAGYELVSIQNTVEPDAIVGMNCAMALQSAKAKLGARSVVQAVALAIRGGHIL